MVQVVGWWGIASHKPYKTHMPEISLLYMQHVRIYVHHIHIYRQTADGQTDRQLGRRAYVHRCIMYTRHWVYTETWGITYNIIIDIIEDSDHNRTW